MRSHARVLRTHNPTVARQRMSDAHRQMLRAGVAIVANVQRRRLRKERRRTRRGCYHFGVNEPMADGVETPHHPAGIVTMGVLSLPCVSVNENTNIRNVNMRFERRSSSSMRYQCFRYGTATKGSSG